jgi:acetoin utilization protein AcuB
VNIENVMIREVQTVEVDATAREVFAMMKEGGYRHVPVVREGKLAGIVSDRDLRLVMTVSHHEWEEAGVEHIPEHVKVGDIMTENPAILVPESDLKHVVQLMTKHKIGALPVVQKGEVVGIVTETDLLKLLLEFLG